MTRIRLHLADSANTVSPPPPVERVDSVDLSRLVAIGWRRRRAILAPVIVALALGVGYLATTPKTYLAASTLLLDARAPAAVRELVTMDTDRISESAIENARLIIRSDVIAAAVADRLDLAANDSFRNPPRSLASRLAGGVKGLLRFPVDMARGLFQSAPAPDKAGAAEGAERARIIRDLNVGIGVERVSRSGGVSVFYRSHDPVLAAAIVNAYADSYIADTLNANFEATERTTEWLQGRLTDLETAAADAASAAEAYRAKNGLFSSEGRFMSEASVSELNADLGEAITEAARSKALVESYEAVVGQGVEGLKSGARIGAGAQVDPALDKLQSDLSSAVADLNRITESFGADHPQAQLMSSAVATAAERLFVGVQQRLERARGEQAVSQARIQALRDSLGIAMGENASAGAAQVELRSLERRAETLSLLYQTFLTQFQEIEQQKDFPISGVRILARAEVPRDADGPRASRVLAAMLVVGLILGTMLAALREWRDSFLRTGEDVTSSGLTFLGYLPDMSAAAPHRTPGRRLRVAARWLTGRNRGEEPERPVSQVSNQAIYTETLQRIRLSLGILLAPARARPIPVQSFRDVVPDGSRKVLGVTSIRPGEGKSTVALDLAGTLASSGARVLLIDADMRHADLSRGFGITSGPSLVDVALGALPWGEARCKHDLPGLDILPCVRPAGATHVAELLAAGFVHEMLQDARQFYDHVVVDVPPLGPVVDARLLIRSLDQLVMVAEWGATPRALLRRVIGVEPALSNRLAGVVLNRVDMVALRDYVSPASVEACMGAYGAYPS